MKKFLILYLLTLLPFVGLRATSITDSVYVYDVGNPIHNLKKDNLRILDIGNSYTVDATNYLPKICKAAGVVTGYSLYTAVRSSSTFKSWVDCYNDIDKAKNTISLCVGDTIAEVATGTAEAGDGSLFRNALTNGKWDLILIHQASTYATNYDAWSAKRDAGYLKELIQIIREANPQATIGLYLIHSYRSDYKNNTEKSSLERWRNIATAVKELRLNYGIDFVIPYGTAVQNLRATSLCDTNEFSTDGTHLATGLGDYVAACCYWETVFAPRTGISILGNTYRTSHLDETVAGVKNITDETALVAQKAAVLSTINKYQVLDVDSFDHYLSRSAEYVYQGNNLIGYNYNSPVGDISIPDSTSAISRGVFNGCERITSVKLPGMLRYIGNYAFNNCSVLTDVYFQSNPAIGSSAIPPGVNCHLAITDSDAADFNTANSNTYADASYISTISEGKYGTIMLPFAPDAASLKNYAFYTLKEAGDGYIKFEEVATPVANTPYLYALREGGKNVAITGGETTIVAEINNYSVGGWEFVASFTKQTIDCTDGNYYAYSAARNEINRITKTLTVSPFRAYLKSTAVQNSNLRVFISGTTGVTEISPDDIEGFNNGAIYDLGGRPVNEPAKGGVYIIDGKKVVL